MYIELESSSVLLMFTFERIVIDQRAIYPYSAFCRTVAVILINNWEKQSKF